MVAIMKNVIVLQFLIISVISKELHIKADLEMKDKGTLIDLFKDEELFKTNERYARHAELVTESVIDHLLSELKQQYNNKNYSAKSPIRRLIRNLSKEIRKNEHNKLVKERQKKKTANKKKHAAKKTKGKAKKNSEDVV